MAESTLYISILIATIAQSTLLVAALLSNKNNNRTSSYFLSAIIILFTYYALIKILCGTQLILSYPYFTQTYRPIPFLIWPILYFYIKTMTDPSLKIRKKDIIHIVPFILYVLFLFPFFLSDTSNKLQSVYSSTPFHYFLAVILQTMLLLVYITLSYRLLYKHQQYIKNMFSNIENIKLNWLKYLMITFVIIWVTAFFNFISGLEYKGEFIVVPVLLCLTIYAIGFYSLRQPDIFRDIYNSTLYTKNIPELSSPASLNGSYTEKSLQKNHQAKYKYSNLTLQELTAYKEQLITYLENEKPYLDNDIKLLDIAKSLGLPTYHLSQVINTQLNRNFYDLINSYRIEKAKLRLGNPEEQDLTILAIAYEVGFNSKSAFNTAFKKNTNITPSLYRQSQLNQMN